jgi:hypothetical protein
MMTLRSRWRSVAVATSVLGVALVVGCSAAESTSPTTGGSVPDVVLTHVHGVDVDDVRERVTIATHYGLLTIDISPTADSSAAPSVLGDYRGDVMAFVRVSDEFLLSGHPPAGSAEAPNVGVVSASLDVTSWQPIALSGEVDFHAMSSVGADETAVVAGLDSVTGTVMTSIDAGRSWQAGSPIAARSIAVEPSGSRLIVTTELGPQVSDDRGLTWAVIDSAPLLVLVAPGVDDVGQPRMVGVDVDGVLHTSSDGLTWQPVGGVPFMPEALGVGEAGTIALVSTQRAMVSRDGGETWSSISDLTLPLVSN